MRKGDIVRLNADLCFSTMNNGSRVYPLDNYRHDKNGTVETYRPANEKEIEDHKKNEAIRGYVLPDVILAQCYRIELIHRDDILVVEKARCRRSWGNFRQSGGWTTVLNTRTMISSYIKRNLLESIESTKGTL